MDCYEDYFSRLVDTMENDYALGPVSRNQERNIRFAHGLMTSAALRELDEGVMARIFHAYTADFGDRAAHITAPRLLRLRSARVQLWEDALIVTDNGGDPRLALGDRIIYVDGLPVPSLTPGPGGDWSGVIQHCGELTVLSGGKRRLVGEPPEPGPQPEPEIYAGARENGVFYIRVPSFENPDAVRCAVQGGLEGARGASRLVIDLRGNPGGYESGLMPLLPFIIAEKKTVSAVFSDRAVITNYTEANCRRLAEALRPLIDRGSRAAEAAAASAMEKSGCGMTEEALPEDETVIEPLGSDTVILTDEQCRGECAAFVAAARREKRARVVGRPAAPSRGTLNPLRLRLTAAISLSYPISVLKSGGFEAAPEVYVPWTPEELARDAIYEAGVRAI